jgi:iron complex transport system ATP-binding protein
MALLQVSNLIAGYGQQPVIRNLFFSIAQPGFVAIVGSNGSGKSTLFKTLAGELVFSGQIQWQGKPIADWQHSGYYALLSQTQSIGFSISVRELVVAGLFRTKALLETYSAADYEQAEQALNNLGYSHLARRDFTMLSGGEQQMAWLAQLMVQDAPLLLLDEPTQHLDVANRQNIFDLMQRWAASGKTVLCITHDLAYLEDMPGWLLNLSAPQPRLEPLSPERVKQHFRFLTGRESLAE